MRIILEIISGPESGKRAVLRAGQVLRIGRTEWADWAVTADAWLSSVHFAVSTSEAGCFLEDLGSSNGTRLNEQPVDGKVQLRAGDVIQAGRTTFRVHEAIFTSTAVSKSPVPVPPVPAGGVPARKTVRYTVETCESGLTLCRGQIEEISPSALGRQLARFVPVYSIIDFHKGGETPPDATEPPRYLFDWLTPEVAATVSPELLGPGDTDQWPSLVDELWGGDSIVTLFSKLDPSQLLDHLRRCLCSRSGPATHQSGVLGLCWPSVTAILLAHHSGGAVKRFLDGVDAVLVELPDLPETWQIFGGEQVLGWLTALGFAQDPPEEETADPDGRDAVDV